MDAGGVATVFVVVELVGVVGLVAAAVNADVRRMVVGNALWLACAVAIAATLGSLYFSEIADFVPCKLCWYQRIAMYPMALVLPIAAIRRDRDIFVYARALAIAGLLIAAYHVWIQWFPGDSNLCEFNNPCSATWVEAFGVVTIPQMAFIAFGLLFALSFFGRRNPSQPTGSEQLDEVETR